MSKSTCSSSRRRVSFSSGSDQAPLQRNKKRSVMTLFWAFRLIPAKSAARFSPESFLRRLRANVAKVLRYVSFKKRSSCCCSKKKAACSNSKSNSSNFNRSHSVSDHSSSMEDSHRAEAVKDCINFFNSSSSSSV